MTMDDLDLLVDWEVVTPHVVNLRQVEYCYFTQLYVTTWTLEVCLEDTYDSSDTTGMTYNFLAGSYDFAYDKVVGTRRKLENQ